MDINFFIGFWPPKTLWLKMVPELQSAPQALTERAQNMLLTAILLAGTFAARPAAAGLGEGVLYAATDTGVIYQVQSSAWAIWYPAPGGVGTVTNVATGTGLTGGPITATGTISLANTAVTPGTYGDASNVGVITVDAQGRITAASEAAISGGGGGGWSLVEKKLITSATQTVTFSSLNGDTDQVYKLIARIKNTAGADCTFTLRPNGVTTNQYSAEFFAYSSTTVSQVSTDLRIFALNNNVWAQAEILFHASKAPNGVAAQRLYKALTAWLTPTPVGVTGFVGGGWNETSTNVTSLDVRASVASGIGSGSELCLYKLEQ